MNALKIPGCRGDDEACDLVLKLSTGANYATLTLSGCGLQVDHDLTLRDMRLIGHWLVEAIKENAAMRKKLDEAYTAATMKLITGKDAAE